jgi:hypothetical protein
VKILDNLPEGLKILDKPQNIGAVVPLSAISPEKDSSINLVRRRGKSITIEIPQRARSNRFLKFFFLICTHNAFNIGITICIILNTALLAMDKHPIEPETLMALE